MLHTKIIKSLFLITFIFLSLTTTAKNYYLSSSSGNDSNSGTSESSPWQSLNKLNSFRDLGPGDNVYFKRGDTFYGTIVLSTSGASGNPITYGSYGSGNKPIITGFTWVNSWVNIGGNVWESRDAVSSLPYTNMVVINNVNTPMGRYPNQGYLTFQSHYGNSSITSDALAGSPNWTGSEVVIKKHRYSTATGKIINHSGNTISYTDNNIYQPIDGFGFFIQNDTKTLDQQNEWYYDPSSKRLRIFSSSMPNNVQVASVDNLVKADWSVPNGNYVTIDNLSFTGANATALNICNRNSITIKNCDVTFIGEQGVNAEGTNSLLLESNNMNYINGNGIRVAGDCPNTVIRFNSVNSSSMIPGMIKGYTFGAIAVSSDNTLVEYNSVQNSGYNGIMFHGYNVKIKNNFVNNSCLIFDDGGGIYTDGSKTGNEVIGNIVLNTIGNTEGTKNTSDILVHGIYLDEGSLSVKVSDNSVSGSSGSGIFLHNATQITITGNTTFDNGIKNNFLQGGLMFQGRVNSPIRNVELKNNIFFAKYAGQYAFFSYSESSNSNDIQNFGSADNNYYVKPIEENTAINIQGVAIEWPGKFYDVSSWKSYLGQDYNSYGAPKSINSTDDLRFVYNASTQSKTISLDATYIDVKGTSYNGSITLQPYTSAVLIRNGASTNVPIVANAGDDQTITLPANSVNLNGSGSGPITSYEWRQIAGPSNVMSSIDNPSASVSNLVKGVYQFELKVNSNNDSKRDTVQVTVNPEQTTVVASITANAGNDQSITLPSNTVKLSGSGSGPITSYQWRQISGPSNVMSSVDNSSTTVKDLVKGVYEFELKVLSSSSSKRDTVEITVNNATSSSVSVSPISVNAGKDQTITLPNNSVSLSGSGSGPITSYQWRQLSGPSNVMTSVDNSSTTVGNLVKGVYQFELKVLSSNSSQRDTVEVTVNSAPTIAVTPITANAGNDQVVTLPNNSVNLSGSGSGPINFYQWRQLSGPSTAMSSVDNSSATVSNLIVGVYEFELKVQSSDDIRRDTVKVTVNNKLQGPDVYSILSANAGSDQTIFLPNKLVKLSGSGTGPIIAYQWRQLDGPTAVISSIDNAKAEVDDLVEGEYTFELKVLADGNISKRDTMKVIVSTETLKANAGKDQKIKLPDNSVNLSGSGSGPITFYQWRQLNGPSTVMSSVDNAAATVNNLIEGVYQFELKVMSGNSISERDTMEVTVVYPPLTVDAGNDQVITLPTNTVQLSGSGTGAIKAYQWRQLAGPSIVMSSIDDASTGVNGMIQGKYQFELKVLDNKDMSMRDTMEVTVNVSSSTFASRTTGSTTNSISTTPTGKTDSSVAVSETKVITPGVPANTSLKIYPNPVEDVTTLQINIEKANSSVLIVITDMQGITVYKKQLSAGIGVFSEQINMSNYAKGSYVITVTVNSEERQTIQALKL